MGRKRVVTFRLSEQERSWLKEQRRLGIRLLVDAGIISSGRFRTDLAELIGVPIWKVADVLRVYDYGFEGEAYRRLAQLFTEIDFDVSVFDYLMWSSLRIERNLKRVDDIVNWRCAKAIVTFGEFALCSVTSLSGVVLREVEEDEESRAWHIPHPRRVKLLVPQEFEWREDLKLLLIAIEPHVLFIRINSSSANYRLLLKFADSASETGGAKCEVAAVLSEDLKQLSFL